MKHLALDDLTPGTYVTILRAFTDAIFPDGEIRKVEPRALYGPVYKVRAISWPFVLMDVPRPTEGRLVVDIRDGIKLGEPSSEYAAAWWDASAAPAAKPKSVLGG